jgi:hypothetical protein
LIVNVEVTGREKVAGELAGLGLSLRTELRAAVEQLTMEMRQSVKAKLSGPVLNIRTAHLIDSIRSEVVETPEGVVGTVASNDGDGTIDPKTGFNYARFWEFEGGTVTVKAHLKAVVRGKTAFLRQVAAHTREAGQRPYMQPTLDEFRGRIDASLSEAVDRGLGRK